MAPESILPFERHDLPDGTVVFYRDPDHAYFRDIKWNDKKKTWTGAGRLTGVSTVVSPIDWYADGLMDWACRLNDLGVAELAEHALSLDDLDAVRDQLRWLSSGPSIGEALADARLTWRHLRDQRAVQGTNVHKHALHALATGKPVPDFEAMTVEERSYARGVIAFWHEHEPDPSRSEFVVAALEHGIAGRPDLIYHRRTASACPLRRLLDCKTTACIPREKPRPFYPSKDQAQVAGYDLCCEQSGFGGTDLQEVLYVDQEGRYELVTSRATHGTFLGCVGVYRENARIRSESNAQAKAGAQGRVEREARKVAA